jgi:uncharacterized protein YcgI (DUF1989 family)
MSNQHLLTVPARRGRAVQLQAGQSLKIINTHGHQVVDFWAFNVEDMSEFLSMEHLRATLNSIFPQAGQKLISNRRRAIMDFVEDTSPGIHDTIMAACDNYRYALLGCTEYHDNCTDNLRAAMRAIGLEAPEVPSPFNIWMNIPVASDGATIWGEPVSKAGDYVVLKALVDTVAVMSCCPQDITPVNAGAPTEVHYQVLG